MLQRGQQDSRLGIIWILAATVLMCHAGAGAQELRTVLATGDDVPGLGRIGRWGLRLVLLDDAGRALVSRVGADREESVWADGDRFSPLIDSGNEAGIELGGHELVAHRAGHAAGFGLRRSEGEWWGEALYSVVGGRLVEVARLGQRDADGYLFCELHSPLVNAAGAVAFTAYVVPDGHTCPDLDSDGYTTPVYEGLYLAAQELQRIGGTGALAPPGWHERSFNLLALSDAGEAIVQVTEGDDVRVLAVRTDGVRVLYRIGEADGPGVLGRGGEHGFQILGANGSGTVLFRRLAAEGDRGGIYRAAAGQVEALVLEHAPTPWGDNYGVRHVYSWPHSFNERGDVLLVFNDGGPAVLYPAAGPPRVFPGPVADGSVNSHGDVALLVHTSDESAEIVRYRGSEVSRLAGTGDRLPSGATLAAGGLGSACVAPNGAVAVTAQTTDGDTALVCGDGSGFAPVIRMGDGRPDGRRFYTFDRCAFASPQELLFLGTSLAPSGGSREYFVQRAAYRAGAERLERVLGPGDLLSDGSRVTSLPGSWSWIFDADASGRLLALAQTNAAGRAALVIAHAEGRRERLPLRLRNNTGRNDEISFPPDSSVDHEYIAGTRSEPAAAAASPAVRLQASVTDPYYDVGAVWVTDARLVASGGVFVMGSEVVSVQNYDVHTRDVFLYVADGLVQYITTSEQLHTDGIVRSLDTMRVKGDRAVFLVREPTGGRTMVTYALGDAAPHAILRSGDASPAGMLRWPEPLAIDERGLVYFVDTPADAVHSSVFAFDNGAIRVIGTVEPFNYWWNDTSDAGALLLSTDSRVHLAGPGADGATCPHPAAIVPPTLVPEPPPPGATPPPEELPFAPAPCSTGTVCLYVGSAAAPPGGSAQVEVYLRTSGEAVAGIQNDLHVPALAQVTECRRNEAIDKEATAFSITDERTRALVISLSDTDPIADNALLYSCTIAVDPSAPPGHYPLGCDFPASSDPQGVALPTSCGEGVLTVTAIESGDAAQSAASGSQGGCAIQPAAGEPAWLLLLGALGIIARRRKRRRIKGLG